MLQIIINMISILANTRHMSSVEKLKVCNKGKTYYVTQWNAQESTKMLQNRSVIQLQGYAKKALQPYRKKPALRANQMTLIVSWLVFFHSSDHRRTEVLNFLHVVSLPLTVTCNPWSIMSQVTEVTKGLLVRLFKKFTVNPLSTNPTKWPNTLKQFVGNLPTNCLSVFANL